MRCSRQKTDSPGERKWVSASARLQRDHSRDVPRSKISRKYVQIIMVRLLGHSWPLALSPATLAPLRERFPNAGICTTHNARYVLQTQTGSPLCSLVCRRALSIYISFPGRDQRLDSLREQIPPFPYGKLGTATNGRTKLILGAAKRSHGLKNRSAPQTTYVKMAPSCSERSS